MSGNAADNRPRERHERHIEMMKPLKRATYTEHGYENRKMIVLKIREQFVEIHWFLNFQMRRSPL